MVETVRDVIISILGILSIIVIIGLLVGMFFVYLKTRKFVRAVNRAILTVRVWLAYIQGMARGLNESITILRKGG